MTVSSPATLINWVQTNTVTQFPNRRSWYRIHSSEGGWTYQDMPLRLFFPMQTDMGFSIQLTRMRKRWLGYNAWWIILSSDSQIDTSCQWPSWLRSPIVYHQHKSQVECIYLCWSFLVRNIVVCIYTQLLLLFHINWKYWPMRDKQLFIEIRFLYNIAILLTSVGRWQPLWISFKVYFLL